MFVCFIHYLFINCDIIGHDKSATLTQCRFDANSVYNITNIIVADFDEFLYCRKTTPKPIDQINYIQNILTKMKSSDIDQVTFPQRIIANLTNSARDCMIDKVKNKLSIFTCFSPYKYIMGAHSFKSIHLGHKCPLTGYHQACPTGQMPRSYDCICSSHHIREYECSFIHLSTNKESYGKRYKYTYDEYEKMKNERNEIDLLLNEY